MRKLNKNRFEKVLRDDHELSIWDREAKEHIDPLYLECTVCGSVYELYTEWCPNFKQCEAMTNRPTCVEDNGEF